MNLVIRSVMLLVFTGWWGTAGASQIQATDIITVGDREWAQPDLFLGLSWNDLNTVCPGGVCSNQTLNGNEMSGWSWATVDDMNQLFNHYIGYDALGPGFDYYQAAPNAENSLTASSAFYGDGWRYFGNIILGDFTLGAVSDADIGGAYILILEDIRYSPTALFDVIGTDGALLAGSSGAWFYRNVSEVPLPATIWLFGSALLGLGVIKRNKA